MGERKDRGQTHAINKGWHQATGSVITWLNSDDYYPPHALRHVGQAFAANPNLAMAFGDSQAVDEQGAFLHRRDMSQFTQKTLLFGQSMAQPAVFNHIRVIEEHGLLKEALYYVMDFEFFLRAWHFYDGSEVTYLPHSLANERKWSGCKTLTGNCRRVAGNGREVLPRTSRQVSAARRPHPQGVFRRVPQKGDIAGAPRPAPGRPNQRRAVGRLLSRFCAPFALCPAHVKNLVWPENSQPSWPDAPPPQPGPGVTECFLPRISQIFTNLIRFALIREIRGQFSEQHRMDKQLNVLYYNTFLPMKMGEGLVSRHFLTAAAQLDGWQLTTIPTITPAMLAESNAWTGTKLGPKNGQRHPTWAALRKSLRRLKSPMSWVPIAPYLYTRKMVGEVTAVIQNNSFDILLLHLSQQDLKTLARVVKKVNLPLVLRAPAPFAYQADHVLQRHMSRADRQHEQFLYETAAAILVISEGMKQLFVKLGVAASKIHVVPNGIDLGRIFGQWCGKGRPYASGMAWRSAKWWATSAASGRATTWTPCCAPGSVWNRPNLRPRCCW